MKNRPHFQHKRKKRSKRSHHKAAESAGLLTSTAIACGVGVITAVVMSLIFSLIALLCGFSNGLVNALGYCAAIISFAACGYVAGKRGRAALPSGTLAACAMTLISVLFSFLPISSPSSPSPIADIFIRLGLAAVAVIFAVIGRNK